MCVVIYLCLTSDSFPPCGRNSHVTARNTAVDPRDLSCNIKTHHVSSEPENISWLYTSFFFGVAIHTTAAVLLYTGLWTSVSKPMFLRRPLDSSLPCRQPQPYFFFLFMWLKPRITRIQETLTSSGQMRPLQNEFPEEEALMDTLNQVASTCLQAMFREFSFWYSKAT